MRYELFVAVIGTAQLALAVLVTVLEYSTRSRERSGRGIGERSESRASAGARRLLSGAPSAQETLDALRNARGADSPHALIRLGLERVRPTERGELARLLREEEWVCDSVADARSLFWWKRFSAARSLELLANERDRATLLRLLGDAHPAVQSAATACLFRYADVQLLLRVIDGLSTASSAIRAHQLGVLREHSDVAAPMLLERIRADAPAHKLYAYINAAAALEDQACMGRVAELSTHPHPEVRVAVARVLRVSAGDAGHIKLLALLRDPDWRVRAQAARGLARVRDDATIAELGRALTDTNWWVRFRAGLTLASMGDSGREVLLAARNHTDRYARDMANLIASLSDSSVAELSAG